MTQKNMHARLFFFKDLARLLNFQNYKIYISKNMEKGSLTQQLLLDSI